MATLELQGTLDSHGTSEVVSSGEVQTLGANVWFGNNDVPRHVGLYFPGVSGLSGATIASATLEFFPTQTDSGDFVGTWYAEDAAAPSVFALSNGNISDRSRTTASVPGNGAANFGTWTVNVPIAFPGDLKTLIQELADSYDPSAIVLLHIYTSGSGERIAYYSSADPDDNPVLTIVYDVVVVSATVTGSATSSMTEAEVRTGGKTVVITLTNDTWVTSGAVFNAQRQNIIDGLDSAQSEALGWNLIRETWDVSIVERSSDTVVTVTLPPSPTYNITAQETITVTVPSTAVAGGNPIAATPSFTVSVVTDPVPEPPPVVPGISGAPPYSGALPRDLWAERQRAIQARIQERTRPRRMR